MYAGKHRRFNVHCTMYIQYWNVIFFQLACTRGKKQEEK